MHRFQHGSGVCHLALRKRSTHDFDNHQLSFGLSYQPHQAVLVLHLRRVRPLLLGKSPDEVRTFIVEQLAQRESFYSKANYTLNVDLLDNFTKIQTTIENLRKILER